jgi:hypothetical protein
LLGSATAHAHGAAPERCGAAIWRCEIDA